MELEEVNPFAEQTIDEYAAELRESAEVSEYPGPTADEKIEYIYSQLKRVEPLIEMVEEKLPTVLDAVVPAIDELKKSPVLRMLGVNLK